MKQKHPMVATSSDIPFKIDIVPLSVNEAWKGRRFKTVAYKQYEHDLIFLLPRIKLPPPPYKIYLEWGFSNAASDFDNPVKMFMDVLQKKYNFNDKHVMEAHIVKKIVLKGKEYISFCIKSESPHVY